MKTKLNDKNFLYNEYVIHNKSHYTIAEEINEHPATVYSRIVKFNMIGAKKESRKNNIEKLMKQKYGMLTPIQFVSAPEITKNKNLKYIKWVECLCDCGKTAIRPLHNLTNKITVSCGCLAHRIGKDNPCFIGYEGISGKFFNHIKRTANGGTNKRKRLCKEFDVDIEFLWKLYLKQNKKCSLSGIAIEFDIKKGMNNGNCSLDRIDSSKGYTEDNVQWVHKKVNIMKNNFDQNEFIDICKSISKFNDVPHV